MEDVYGKIGKPFWDDRPVAVIAGGPSLMDFDFEQLRDVHVLAVKRRIFDIPWADAGFAIDMPRNLVSVQCRIFLAMFEGSGASPAKNITFLKRIDGQGLSEDPGEIYGGGTSSFGALQVCIHKRAREIVLFGFDYDGNYDAGWPHFNEKFYEKRRAQDAKHWAEWAEHFSVYVPHLQSRNINVLNACPASAIRCFQKVSLQDGVAMLRRKIAGSPQIIREYDQAAPLAARQRRA